MKTIYSTNNDYIKKISNIKEDDKEYFLLEGINVIKEAINKNIVKEIFLLENHLTIFSNFKNIILINRNVLSKISSLKNPNFPIALCFKKINYKSKSDKRILLLDNIQDPGNLGCIIRTAAALKFDKIITSDKSVSLYNPKVLRATQGAFLFIEIIQKINLNDKILKLKENNYHIIGTFLNKEHNFNNDINTKNSNIALLLGSEGTGINKVYEKYIDSNYRIKISNNIESLNLAIAASIIMYALSDNY